LPIEARNLAPGFSVQGFPATDNCKSKIVNRQSSILPVAATTAPATTTAAAGKPAATAPATSPATRTASAAAPEVIARWTRFVDGQSAAL
jgi:hypothetical protein